MLKVEFYLWNRQEIVPENSPRDLCAVALNPLNSRHMSALRSAPLRFVCANELKWYSE